MKYTIQIDSDDEMQDYLLCSKYKAAIEELFQELRKRIKYAPDGTSDEVIEAYASIRDFMNEELEGIIF